MMSPGRCSVQAIRRWVVTVAAIVAATRPAVAVTEGADSAPDVPLDIVELDSLSLEDLLDARVVSTTLQEQEVATTPSIVSVLTRHQIRSLGLRRLSEALQLLAGVTVVDTLSGVRDVTIRGVRNPASILVTLDGQPLNDFYDGEVLVDFPIELVERIEVIRGPGSALYGTGAFAGVISLFTRRAEEQVAAEAAASALYGDELTAAATASGLVATRLGRSTVVRAMATTRHSQGPRFMVEDDVHKGAPYAAVPGLTNAFEHATVARAVVQRRGVLWDSDTLELASTGIYQRRGPFFGAYRVFSPDTVFVDSLLSTFLDYAARVGQGVSATARLSYDQHGNRQRLVEQPDGFYYDINGNGQADADETFPNGKIRRTNALSGRLSVRAYVQHDHVASGDGWANHALMGLQLERAWMPRFRFAQNFDHDRFMAAFDNYADHDFAQKQNARTVSALFAQDQIRLGDLWLTVGLRVDHYSDFGAALSPRAALVWKALPGVACKFLYGRAFRAPTFKELYDNTSPSPLVRGGSIFGNPDLPAESNNTVEAGVDLDVQPWGRLRASIFYDRTDNSIELDRTIFSGGTTYVAYPGRQMVGGDLEMTVLLGRRDYVLANASYFEAQQLGEGLPGWQQSNDRRFVKKDLHDIPRLRLNALAAAELASWLRASATYSYVGSSRSNRRFVAESLFGQTEQEAFHSASVNGQLKLADNGPEITARITRTFGEKLSVPLSYRRYDLPRDELVVMIGLAYGILGTERE